MAPHIIINHNHFHLAFISDEQQEVVRVTLYFLCNITQM